MAVGAGYTTSIRKALNDKGVDNSRIGYSGGNVTVDGQNFYKPEKNYNGATYTSPTNFANAYNTFNQRQTSNPVASVSQGSSQQSYQPNAQVRQANQQRIASISPATQQQPQQPQQSQQQYSYNPYQSNNQIANNPYTGQTDALIQQLLNFGQNQSNFDPYSSSAYQAAQAQANRAAQQNTRAVQEAYGGSGFGRSTAMGERVAGINNEATEYLMTQVLPQIEAQEAARRQQEYSNLFNVLNPLMSQQGRADNLVQQDFQNRVTEGQLTGNYMNPEATQLINQLLNLKTTTEDNWMDLTPEQRVQNNRQADVMRNQLAALGINPDLFGADITSSNAGQNRGLATRTLQGQQLDAQNQQYQQQFEYQQQRDAVADRQWQDQFGVTLAQITGYFPDGTPTSAQQQQELNNLWMVADQTGAIPAQLASVYGLQAGTPTRAAKEFAAQLAISQQNTNISAGNLALSREKFNYDKQQDTLDRMSGGTSSSKSSTSAPKIDSKKSYTLYNDIVGDFAKAESFSGQRAMEYLQQFENQLTDADYRKALDYIAENGM